MDRKKSATALPGCLQIQRNKFPGHILQSSSRFFTLIEPPKYHNYMYNEMASRTISTHIYKYEFWNVFIWACDDELWPMHTESFSWQILGASMYKNYTVMNFSTSSNKIPGDFQFFQEL